MGKTMDYLRDLLYKSEVKTKMLSGLCTDSAFISKVLNEYQRKEIEKMLKETTIVVMSEERIEDIARYILDALNEVPPDKRMDLVKKTRPFLEELTRIMYEFKNSFSLEDYCVAINSIRYIAYGILPSERLWFYKAPEDIANAKVKAYTAPSNSDEEEEDEEQNEAPARRPFGRVNFLTKDLENAQDWIATIAIHGETEDILKDRYQDMAKCSAKIRKTISEDSYLKKRFQTLASVFGDWLAEQLYGGHPEIMALVDKHNEDEVMLEKVFFLYAKRIGGSGDIDLMCEMHKVWYKDEEADSKKTEAELRKTQAELIVEESDFVRGKRPIKTAVTKKPAATKTKKPNTKSPKEEKSEEQLSDEEIELMLDQNQELQDVLAAFAAEPSMEEIMNRSMRNALAATGLNDTEEEQPDKEQQELNEDFQKWIREHAGEFASKWWDEHLKKAHERGDVSTADLQKQDKIAKESK